MKQKKHEKLNEEVGKGFFLTSKPYSTKDYTHTVQFNSIPPLKTEENKSSMRGTWASLNHNTDNGKGGNAPGRASWGINSDGETSNSEQDVGFK